MIKLTTKQFNGLVQNKQLNAGWYMVGGVSTAFIGYK